MITYLTFAGKSSRDFKVYISGQGTYSAPARVYTAYEVPGRSGKLYVDQKRYENIEVSYPAFVFQDMRNNVDSFRNFLLSQVGYQRLEDTYHPDEYRMAMYKDGLEVGVDPHHEFAAFDLTFDCKPQRFLKSGDEAVTLTSNGSIYNPTPFESNPLIKVYGYGTLTINGDPIVITSYSFYSISYIRIDCENMMCTDSGNYYNFGTAVTFTNHNYPVLIPGENTVSMSGEIRQVDIIPHWWTL